MESPGISDQSHFLIYQEIILSCQQIGTECHKYLALLATVGDSGMNSIQSLSLRTSQSAEN